IILTAYVSGLDNFTMNVYLIYGATVFNGLVQWTTLAVIQSMIFAIGKPIYAKTADIFGRAFVYALSLLFLTIGTLVIATSQGINTLAGGVVFFALGNCGLTLVQQLILADLVPPRWRALVGQAVTLHFVINFGISSKITGALIPDRWRWGPATFSILNPIVTLPIIIVLGVQQRATVRAGIIRPFPYEGRGFLGAVKAFLIDIDILGMLCFAGGFLLLLLPLTIANRAPNGYDSGYIIAMFVVGGILLLVWPLIELRVSKPLVNLRTLFTNVDVILPCVIYFLDDFSYGMTSTPALNWVEIVFNWNTTSATYFLYAQSLSLVIFGVVGGAIAAYTRHYKRLTVFGACLRLLGLGLMIRYRSAGSSTFQIVMPQVIQGMGGGFMTCTLLVAAQAAVSHANVGVITGFVLLTIALGSALGSAVVGSIQQRLLVALHKYVDPIAGNSTLAVQIYGGGVRALARYPLGTPIRTATIQAWSENMHDILSGAIIIAGIGVVACVFLPDRRLSEDKQNNVTAETVQPLVPLAAVSGRIRLTSEPPEV
ncbi:hypothetical protein TREMEDRAFT_36224, partial [Tremella mesenterica DSM 1558]|uniref:uncharacterized protein n=1 Tax=Tremella mesenterica (strain ATCC 24925 / CBS 8224 / DSM 1558 / NBRC 9311 / NRRL Y-6157 / RJB 2259-6 / UBC 559-6) TaxID=578456 RepID=UPI00032D6559